MSRHPNYGAAKRFLNDIVMTHEDDVCLTWPFACDTNGYGLVRDGPTLRNVHRVICERVHGPAPSPEHEAAHSCGHGKQGCVAKGHIRWKTPVENHAEKNLHGTVLRGEANPQAVLSEGEARLIAASTGKSEVVASEYGISGGHVRAIRTRAAWRHLSEASPCSI